MEGAWRWWKSPLPPHFGHRDRRLPNQIPHVILLLTLPGEIVIISSTETKTKTSFFCSLFTASCGCSRLDQSCAGHARHPHITHITHGSHMVERPSEAPHWKRTAEASCLHRHGPLSSRDALPEASFAIPLGITKVISRSSKPDACSKCPSFMKLLHSGRVLHTAKADRSQQSRLALLRETKSTLRSGRSIDWGEEISPPSTCPENCVECGGKTHRLVSRFSSPLAELRLAGRANRALAQAANIACLFATTEWRGRCRCKLYSPESFPMSEAVR
jgi:hypothetical protein